MTYTLDNDKLRRLFEEEIVDEEPYRHYLAELAKERKNIDPLDSH